LKYYYFGHIYIVLVRFFHILPIDGGYWATPRVTKNPSDGNDPRISKLKRLFTMKANFIFSFEYENVLGMKNKHDPALLRTSHLSNKIVKRTPKSHETITLVDCYLAGLPAT
jgi:hypothetical protein